MKSSDLAEVRRTLWKAAVKMRAHPRSETASYIASRWDAVWR